MDRTGGRKQLGQDTLFDPAEIGTLSGKGLVAGRAAGTGSTVAVKVAPDSPVAVTAHHLADDLHRQKFNVRKSG